LSNPVSSIEERKPTAHNGIGERCKYYDYGWDWDVGK